MRFKWRDCICVSGKMGLIGVNHQSSIMEQKFQDGPDYPKAMDNNDRLGHFRQRFCLKKGVIYMCGNCIGLCSKDAEDAVLRVINGWKQEGANIWSLSSEKYYFYSNHLAKLMAPLINADPDEVVVTGSTTTNIHQAISTLYKPANYRYKILVDNINFSSDRYAVDSQVRLKGYEPKDAVKVVKSRDGKHITEDDIIRAMTKDVILILLSAVLFKSGQLLDIEKISRVAKEREIIIGWDLCHAIGVVEIDFKAIEVDFAVWCTYKYLNGGPGSTGAMYLNRKHFNKLPGLAGWFGNNKETQLLFRQDFDHQQDASGWQISSPNILSMAALEGSLKILNEAGISNIRKKSSHITAYLMFLIDTKLIQHGFTVGSLKEDNRRGGHVSVEHDDAYKICLAMKNRGIEIDFKYPNVLRITPVALYNTYTEVYNTVIILLDIMKTGSYKKISVK